MSIQAAAEFMARLATDATLKMRLDADLATATDPLAAFSELARREGFDVEPKDVTWVPKRSELSEQQLDGVVGGALLSASVSTSAGGDIVLKGKNILQN